MSRYNEDDSLVSDFDDDESDDDRDVLKPTVHHMGLGKDYSPKWTPKDAFRELYQNWKDGIVQSFGIDHLNVKPEVKSTSGQIQITVHDLALGGGVPRLLGYIRFNKRGGNVEVTNFKAKLERKHLDLGETSKWGRKNQAGCHGEGFKLAALVMLRNGHSFKFETNAFYWNFGLRGTRPSLSCRLTQPSADILQRKRDEPRSQRGFSANILNDMCVKVGKSRGDQGQRVSEEEFRNWMTVSLELDPPKSAEFVRTKHGDLILDSQFQGRIYLRGLRVDGHGPDGREYRFGYNFHQGYINRDRERLTNRHEEAQILTRIWAEAIERWGDRITDYYIELFDEEEERSDILLASEYVSPETAETIFARLKYLNPGDFFYSDDETEVNKTKDKDIIINDFQKCAKKLKKNLWKILRRDPPLVRTPQEERAHLFETSQRVEPENNVFATSIIRTLKGSMMLNPKLKDIQLDFVEGGATNIDVLYIQHSNQLLIHQRWLSFTYVHQDADCDLSKIERGALADVDTFFCDHAVQDLLELTLNEVSGPVQLDGNEVRALRRKANECLRQMPRHVTMIAPEVGRVIEVSWAGTESRRFAEQYGENILDIVTLHDAACSSRLSDILSTDDTGGRPSRLGRRAARISSNIGFRRGSFNHGSCTCQHITVSRASPKARFNNLDPRKTYFPLVSRADKPSFFGLPPSPLAPKEVTIPTPRSADSGSNSVYGSVSPVGLDGDSDEDSESSAEQDTLHAIDKQDISTRPHTNPTLNSNVFTDETSWEQWQATQLPMAFARLIPSRSPVPQISPTMVLSLEHQPLRYTFETDEYACVSLNGEDKQQVIFVHSISERIDSSEAEKYCLSVTRYSFLDSTYPFKERRLEDDSTINGKELVLRFRNFDKMGTRDDAEVIKLEDILSVRGIDTTATDGVTHVVQQPQGNNVDTLFCRYAIRTSEDDDAACITPLASHLLPRQNRWPRPKLSTDAGLWGFDLSPNVLGVSEGISQAGFLIKAALGFDETKDATWKVRHSSLVFDGSLPKAFNDLDSGHLLPPELPAGTAPRLVFLSGGRSCFRFNKENQQMPSLKDFLHPLEILDESFEGLKADFAILLMPSAILHPEAIDRLSKTILVLLEKRLSVHLRLTALQDLGVPQEGSIVTIIASPLCAPLPWSLDELNTTPTELLSVGNVIRDLTFENRRDGFVCSPPARDELNGEMPRARYVYNHKTGQQPKATSAVIPVSHAGKINFLNGPKPWMHPTRGDRLTVRELARVQGFADDFVFYGPLDLQYQSVCRGVPPILAKKIGETILRAMRSSSVVRVRHVGSTPLPERGTKRGVKDEPAAPRPSKRARVEDAEDEDL